MEICHLTLTAVRESRLPLFPTAHVIRRGLHRIGRIVRDLVALFALLDEHVHLVLLASYARTGRLAQSLICALNAITATPVAPSHRRMVESRGHMRWLVRYVLEQATHHELPGHPALYEGSCIQELTGARRVPGLTLRLTEALPRFDLRDALKIVKLASLPAPADAGAIRAAGADRLVAATGAALADTSCAPMVLAGQRAPARLGRRLVAQLGRWAGTPTSELVRTTGLSARALRRLANRAVDAAALIMVRQRLALEDRVLGLAMPAPSGLTTCGVRRTG